MGGSLHHGHLKAPLGEILRHLQADEPGAHHHAGFGLMLLDKIIDRIGIRDISQGKYVILLHPGYGRLHRGRAGRKHQLVVALLINLFPAAHPHRLLLCIHGNSLAVRAHIHPEAAAKSRHGLHLEGSPVSDHSAHIVGKAAVCVGNIFSPLQHDNLRILVQPAKPGRCACASGHAAYNHNLHCFQSPFTALPK